MRPFIFQKKEFKILDLGSPINDISHYGACTFQYNLALKGKMDMSNHLAFGEVSIFTNNHAVAIFKTIFFGIPSYLPKGEYQNDFIDNEYFCF